MPHSWSSSLSFAAGYAKAAKGGGSGKKGGKAEAAEEQQDLPDLDLKEVERWVRFAERLGEETRIMGQPCSKPLRVAPSNPTRP